MNAMRDSVRKPFLFLSFLLILNASRASGQIPARVLEAVDNSHRITLNGNVHPLARAEFDRGVVAPSQPVKRILLLLQRSDAQEAALQTYLDQQQDKGSPNYHVWLPPVEFGTLYGPADADIQAVTQWLASEGFTLEKVYSGKTVIEFSGNAGQVQSAFGAVLHNYEVNGKTYVANANDPQIPASLAPAVAGIVSLNNFPRRSHVRLSGMARKVAGKPGIEPLFTFPNGSGSGNFYGVGPGDFATIYNSKSLITGGNDGTGQTIAVVGETDINVADVQAFRQLFGLSANFDATNIILNGEDPGITSTDEELEADLDVQWSGAVAPGATIKFVVSDSTPASQGIDLSALYIIENNLAGVMSESYGNCESALGSAGNAFYNTLWEQAAAQGITVVVSAGDGGSAGCDDFDTATVATLGLAVSGLASSPYNVALGGTDFDQVNKWSTFWSLTNNATTGTSALSYIPEIPWNENCAQIGLTGCGSSAPQGSVNIVAGSGGPSQTYSKPKWQMGINGMPNDNHRDLPDVSLFASPGFDGSGYIVCPGTGVTTGPSQCNVTPGTYTFAVVGGTSASAPAFAGIMALVNQYQSAHSGSARQGNANYVLYALAKQTGKSCTSTATEAAGCIFNDVTKGNSVLPTGSVGVGTNSAPCQGATANCSAAVASATGVLVEPTSSTTEAWTVTPGYDMVTGLGSVNVNNLAANWSSVNTVPTTTTLTLTPTQNITHGSSENVIVNISVTPKTGTATGDVSLVATLTGSSGTTSQGVSQYTLGTSGTFTGTTQDLPGGTYTVTAHYAGDGTNAPSDSTPPVPVTVAQEGSKTFPDLVTFDINGNPTNFAATNATYGSGYAIFRLDVGDAASSVLPSTGISSNCSKGISTCPTGVVSLASTGSSLGSSSLALNVLGYAETGLLVPGTYIVTATYPGDSSYSSSTGAASITIAQAPVTLEAWLATPIPLGNFDQINASVMTTSDGVAPNGVCQFFVDGTPIGAAVPIDQSNPYTPGMNPPYAWAAASSGTSFTSVGNHVLTAQYSGDSNYSAAISAPAPFTVTQGSPYFSAYANPNTINVGQQTILIATVGGTVANLAPTGTVTFLNGNTPLSGTITYTSSANILTANLPFTPKTLGTYQISANYSGDSNYMAATPPIPGTLTVTGPDFTLTPQPASVTVSSGSSATYTIAIAGTNGFTGNVNVACSTIAAATTCSANPSSVAAGSSTTITVTTTKHQGVSPTPNVPVLRPGIRIMLLSTSTALAILLLIYGAYSRPRRRLFAGALCATAFLGVSLLAIGCGGGGGSGGTQAPPKFGTQPNTYQVIITGTTSISTHTVIVALTVD